MLEDLNPLLHGLDDIFENDVFDLANVKGIMDRTSVIFVVFLYNFVLYLELF